MYNYERKKGEKIMEKNEKDTREMAKQSVYNCGQNKDKKSDKKTRQKKRKLMIEVRVE